MTRKMKDSGIEWIGEIPEDWELTKVKHIGKYINGYPFKPSDWSDSGVPIIRIQNLTGNNSEYNYYSGPKLPEDYFIIKNDYLISWSASLGVFIWHKDKGYLNQHIFKAVPNESIINYDYFYWIAKIFIDEIQSYMHGSAMQHVTKNVFDNFTVPLPSGKQEQIKISEVLSSKIAFKNSIKQNIIKEIQTLEDYKKSVITEAVTKGLDKNVEMKDSGIEWIGEVPNNWEITKVKYIGKLQNGISKNGEFFGKGYPFVSYGDVYKNFSIPNNVNGLIQSNLSEQSLYSVKEGDVFFTRTSETLEEIGYSSVCLKDLPKATFAGFLIRMRPYKPSKIIPNFSKYYFRSEHLREYLAKEMTIVTRASLGQQLLNDMVVLLPNIEEQKRITSYLDEKCGSIDRSIELKQKQLEVLEEYKKSLIYEYVTGKKEVEEC